jgi:hypothetical protein
MQQEIKDAVSVLVGKSVWRCTLAADMACFQFGERRIAKSFRDGSERQVGEYALHLQCPWRIVKDEKVLLAALDVYKPQGGQDDTPDFDWATSGNLLEERIATFFEHGAREYSVEGLGVGPAGAVRLSLEGEFSFEIYPSDSAAGEHWRLFQPGIHLKHFVVTGVGITNE